MFLPPTERGFMINIAAYKFSPLDNLKELRETLLRDCRALGLRGTILLSQEGINLFLSGTRDAVNDVLALLRRVPGLGDLQAKFSEGVDQPFHRLLVKIKREIIAFGIDGIDPVHQPAPRISPRELKQWLDEGRPVTLLDTRNDYEIRLGTFRHARQLDIQHFRDFPTAVRELPESLKQAAVVTFCTGGIRCEKAAPYLIQQGFQNVLQLDGGILKYFEDCGSAHYDGECFVFDQRVGLDPSLRETDTAQCHRCQTPLTPAEQQDPRFISGESCPYCYCSDTERQAQSLRERGDALRAIINPLPGSQPYDNYRPVRIPVKCAGLSLLECLVQLFPHVPAADWERHCDEGRMVGPSDVVVGRNHRVQTGERYLQRKPGTVEPDVNAALEFLYEDEAIVVLSKPAPLPMHPCGRFNRNTLQYILSELYKPQSPRPAHRLDANTQGVIVFSRTRHIASRVQPQFERGEVAKVYLARVLGHPALDTFECRAAISEESGNLGSRETVLEGGLAAHTEFRVLSRDSDGTSLLEVVPRTGRTNQIRVHLWHLGWSICGDPAYLPDRQIGDVQTLTPGAPPMCLLAWKISLTHPLTHQRMSFEAPLPAWARTGHESPGRLT